MFPKASPLLFLKETARLGVAPISISRIHWANGALVNEPLQTRKKVDLEAQLRIIQVFGVFHDFGETGSGGGINQKERWIETDSEPLQIQLPCFQNLTEMPPRTERRPDNSCVSISPFSVAAWASNRFRASSTASARTGNPKLGKSCVI